MIDRWQSILGVDRYQLVRDAIRALRDSQQRDSGVHPKARIARALGNRRA